MQDIQLTRQKKCTCFASHFDGHADQAVRCQVHHPVRQVKGYPRCHWTPPSGKYSPRIAPADAMVINFGVTNRVVALWKSLSKIRFQKTQNGPSTSTQLIVIELKSCIERSNATMKAEELS
jgi:hypothetical protein